MKVELMYWGPMKSAPKTLYNPFRPDSYLGRLEVVIDGKKLGACIEMDPLMARDIPYRYIQEKLQREILEGIRKELFQ